MNGIRIYAALIVMSYGVAWGATLTWNANTELDLAGYRVYQCSQLPCSRASGTATPLATLGNVTNFNIGTPTITQYFVVTAYDSANNESSESNVTTYTPAGAPPPPPTPVPIPPTTPPPAIGASPLALAFSAQQGRGNPASQNLNISNTGGGTLSWAASENSPWLTLTPAAGTDSGTVTISVTTGTRTAGTYAGAITVSATGASPVTVPITFIVSAPSGSPPPAPPPTPSGLRLTAIN